MAQVNYGQRTLIIDHQYKYLPFARGSAEANNVEAAMRIIHNYVRSGAYRVMWNDPGVLVSLNPSDQSGF